MTAHESENTGFLGRIGLGRPALRAWALYDWANSAFMTTVVAAVFPIYFAKVAAAGMAPEDAQTRYALGTAVALLLVAFVAPPLGALADRRAWRKRLLFGFALLGVLATAALFLVVEGDWVLALLCFGLGNLGAGASVVFYDSLLPHIAGPDEVDRTSTAGFALGYLGGGILLAANLAWIQRPELLGFLGLDLEEGSTLPTRLAFVSVAIWWLAFTVPLMRRVPEPAALVLRGPGRGGLLGMRATLREIRSFPNAFLMLAAFLIYNDGVVTIIRMATIYGQGIGLGTADMIGALLLVQFIGIPCSFLFGGLAGRLGAKRSILVALSVYAVVALLGFFMRTAAHFYLLAILVGLVQGGAQALSRSLFASLVPRQKSGEFFGFFAVGEKFAGVFGPLLFGTVLATTDSSRMAMGGVLLFFVVGGAILLRVDVDAGRAQARAAEAAIE
ncbi:MAG: MFS transporter [Planctomycetota bacterium]|nr:MFS transporter [Planctomycetota bacterium]